MSRHGADHDSKGRFTAEQTDEEIREELERICEHVENGLFVKYACAEVGASYSRVKERRRAWDWYETRIDQAIGRQAQKRLERAAELEARGASTKHQEWILERLDRAEFGREHRTELTGAGGGPVELLSTKIREALDDDGEV